MHLQLVHELRLALLGAGIFLLVLSGWFGVRRWGVGISDVVHAAPGDGPILFGDLNHDGIADAFMWVESDRAWTVYLSNGSDFFQRRWTGAWGSDGVNHVGDLNNDGRVDVFMWRDSDKVWTVNLSNGTGFDAQIWKGDWGSDGPINVGDLNGDGKIDVFMWRDSDKVWTVNLSNGTGFDAQTWTGDWGSDGPINVGDLNGDGKVDVFMWRDSDKVWTVNLSNGIGFDAQTWTGDWGSDGPINVADLNGDGMADVFMWRDSNKDWTVNLSTGTGFNAQTWTGDWGSDGPINVGDVSGDGKADVFMWRGDVWTVNISTGTGFETAMWPGGPGEDGAHVSKLNRDRFVDVAMYHPTTRSWTVNLSTGSGWNVQTWPKGPPDGPCKFGIPHGPPVVLDLEQTGTLGFTADVRVINVYWGGNNWNGIPAHKPVDAVHYGFQKEDIDAATRALFSTDYFEKLCQYGGSSGGPRVTLLRSTDTGQALNPCLPHVPQNNFTAADVFQFVSCEEGLELTDVPHANGVPSEVLPGATGLACQLCGVTLLPCYLDGVCMLVPNSTGDLIINVIPPKDKHFFGVGDCKTGGYHFQVPSNAFGYPFFPLVLTQGRPIYFTLMRTECFENIDEMMGTLSHELVETLSDPYPGAFWYDTSHGQTGANGENADICKRATTNGDYDPGGARRAPAQLAWNAPMPDAMGMKNVAHNMNVAFWWSNYDHDCIAPLNSTPIGPPIRSKDPCQIIADAIEKLQDRLRNLQEELKDANGVKRTIIQGSIRAINQQIKSEEEAQVRCRAGKKS